MHSRIGTSLARPRWRAISAAAIGLAAAAVHMTLFAAWPPNQPSALLTGGFTLAVLAALAHGDRRSLGLVLVPERGWLHWGWMTLVLGLLVLLFIVVALVAARFAGFHLEMPALPPAYVWIWIRRMCIEAPLVEECIYRLALCTGLAALAGPRVAIIASGVLFAALHFVYGNAWPDNTIAGFVLSWAYLRSGTILVPIALHALGNLCVLLAAIAYYDYLY